MIGERMKLNLGCGKDYIDGWVNVDLYDDSKCDVVYDLEKFPWPWEDNSVSEILIKHTLEHLGEDWKVYIKVLQEMYRICEDDAEINVFVPSPWHRNFTDDPTHVRPVTPDGLNLFSKEHCQSCIDNRKSETPFAMIYDVDFRVFRCELGYDAFWWNKVINGEILLSKLEELHNMYRNVVAEFKISIAVVKAEESDKKHRYEYKLQYPDGGAPHADTPSNVIRS